jgi:hypothetical protein
MCGKPRKLTALPSFALQLASVVTSPARCWARGALMLFTSGPQLDDRDLLRVVQANGLFLMLNLRRFG